MDDSDPQRGAGAQGRRHPFREQAVQRYQRFIEPDVPMLWLRPRRWLVALGVALIAIAWWMWP